MFGIGTKQASRVGLKPVKALFSIQIVSVTLPRTAPILDQAKLSVCFERGGKISSTSNVTYEKPAYAREVVVPFEQKVELMATLYKDFKTGRYQEKVGTVILREMTKNNRFGHETYKGWGRCNLNLHDLLAELGFERTRTKEATLTFSLLNGSTLKVIITSTIMNTGKDADSMSVASYMTEGSEFSSMAASFSHYAPSNTAKNTSNAPFNTHQTNPDDSEEEGSQEKDRVDSDVESHHSEQEKALSTSAAPPLPRTFFSYLSSPLSNAPSNSAASADGALPSARSQNSFKPEHEAIVESPIDKRQNYDLSDSDSDNKSENSIDEESCGNNKPSGLQQQPIAQDKQDRKDSGVSSDLAYSSTSSTLGTGQSLQYSANPPNDHTEHNTSNKNINNNKSSKRQDRGVNLLPLRSRSPAEENNRVTSSVKNRFRDLLGRRKGPIEDTVTGTARTQKGNTSNRSNNNPVYGEGEGDHNNDDGDKDPQLAPISPLSKFMGMQQRSDDIQPEEVNSPASPVSNTSTVSNSSISPRLNPAEDKKLVKRGMFSKLMQPLKGTSERLTNVPTLSLNKDINTKVGNANTPPESFVPIQPDSSRTVTSESSKEAFSLYDQELKRRGEHVALLERRLAEQSAQFSAAAAAQRAEIAALQAALRKEKVARAALTAVTHKGDDRLAAALSEARDEAASATSECARLQQELRVLCAELQESRDQETRLRRGQDGEMHMMQEAAAVAASSSVQRAAAEEENVSLVQSLIDTKMQNANMYMEMEEVKRENSLLKKRMQVYAQQVASLEVKYAHAMKRANNGKQSSNDDGD